MATWEWHILDGEPELIQMSPSPSPPYRPTSSSRLSFDPNLAAAHKESAIFIAAHIKNLLAHGLQWRQQWLMKAENRRKNGNAFVYMGPWQLDMRISCASFLDLLDWYFGMEVIVGARIEERLEDLAAWELNAQDAAELKRLFSIYKKRWKDEEAGHDFLVVHQVRRSQGLQTHKLTLRGTSAPEHGRRAQ
ncbi:hypothetical protein CC78DRAFT_535018 [Lojkania enalia]|uniref:Uncharacterized protein n=1 Tax=Lojkania enalia TaxID=147567 RepID=A0A9P4N223_9PLEO|nr:hypothetical protein CC78DRAFT_535018 [Didymosphaeria enalia]